MKKDIKKVSIIGILILAVLSLSFVSADSNDTTGWNNITLCGISISVPNTTSSNTFNVNNLVDSYVDDANEIMVTATDIDTDDNPYLISDNSHETIDNYEIYNENYDGKTSYAAAVKVNSKTIFVYSQNKDQLLTILKSINGATSIKCDSSDNATTNLKNKNVTFSDDNNNNHDHDYDDDDDDDDDNDHDRDLFDF